MVSLTSDFRRRITCDVFCDHCAINFIDRTVVTEYVTCNPSCFPDGLKIRPTKNGQLMIARILRNAIGRLGRVTILNAVRGFNVHGVISASNVGNDAGLPTPEGCPVNPARELAESRRQR